MSQKSILKIILTSIVLLICLSIRAIADTPVKIMPLGDSITYGVGSTDNGYRGPLGVNLATIDCNFDFVGSQPTPAPDHEGHPGWHADGCPIPSLGDILDNVYNWLTANPADIVLLHIGTNDITYGGQDANEVSDILDEIDRFSTDTKVILALIINRRADA